MNELLLGVAVKLLTELLNINIHHVGADFLFGIPRPLENLLPTHGAPLTLYQHFEQLPLAGGECHGQPRAGKRAP